MKTKNNIFSGFKLGIAPGLRTSCFVGLTLCSVICALCSVSAHAAIGDCTDENNDRINPDIALCTVHAYNIGLPSNPDSPGEKTTMNDVVAMKTTIMTQQMKKQYDYLEVTIKRFKTQLEKAILTAKMEAAGAGPGAADKVSGYGAGYKGMGDECTGKGRADTVYCLRENYKKMNAAVNSRSFSNELKEQVKKDTQALYYMDQTLMSDPSADGKVYEISRCSDKTYLTTTTIPECLWKISGATQRLEEGGKQQQSYGAYSATGRPGG